MNVVYRRKYSLTFNGSGSSGLLPLIFWFFIHFLSNTSGLFRRSVIDDKRPEIGRLVDCPTFIDVDARLVFVANIAGVAAAERGFVSGWPLSWLAGSVFSIGLLFDDNDSFNSESIFVEVNRRSNRSLPSLRILRRPSGSSWNGRKGKWISWLEVITRDSIRGTGDAWFNDWWWLLSSRTLKWKEKRHFLHVNKRQIITSACAVAALNDAVGFSLDVFVIIADFASDGRPFEWCILTSSCGFLLCWLWCACERESLFNLYSNHNFMK